jgi:hypothetical protein
MEWKNPCTHEGGCNLAAIGIVQLFIPPVGFPDHKDISVAIMLEMPLCDKHIKVLKPKDLMNMHIHAIINEAEQFKQVKADLDRAWIEPVKYGSREYKIFTSVAGSEDNAENQTIH